MIENVADITAWLPTTAANVATMKTGQNTGSIEKKGQKWNFSKRKKTELQARVT